jgi:dihydrofolate reductase
VISIVVARASNGVIGRDGGLPWHLPADMRKFRELTTACAVVMGRRTFESLPAKYRPLPHRRNLVLSSSLDRELPGAEVFPDLASALEACAGECFVIGGAVAYRDALPMAGRVYATEIECELDGDAFFPELRPSEWQCVERSERIVENELGFTFAVYERTSSLTV